jgi:hypothetical protein
MDFHVLGKAREFFPELVAAGNLECHKGNLPRTCRRLQGLFEAADVQDEDSSRAEFSCSCNGDGANEAAVEEVFAVDLNRWQEAGNGTGRKHCGRDGTRREPRCGGTFDTGRDALESDGEISEFDRPETLFDQSAERIVAVDMSPMTSKRADLTEYRSSEDAPIGKSRPHLDHPSHHGGSRLGGDERTVQGAHARADDKVRSDPTLE